MNKKPDNISRQTNRPVSPKKTNKLKKLIRYLSKHRKQVKYSLITAIIVLPYIGMWWMSNHKDITTVESDEYAYIVIDKEKMTLTLYNYCSEPLMEMGIACGSNYGNKREKGDYRTPEGVFKISQIQDASTWDHDFGDGKGKIPGAYGPYFLRLATPGHKGIGIHGTHDAASIGTRATEGCIRLNNEDIARLHDIAYIGMPVIILPSKSDIKANAEQS